MLRDLKNVKVQKLDAVLKSSEHQLEEAENNIEEIKSILYWAKNPHDRTAINIILDDQKKVVKALGRLVDDLSEICSQTV